MKIIDKHGNRVHVLQATEEQLAVLKKHYPEYYPTLINAKVIELIIGKDNSVNTNVADMELEKFYEQTGYSAETRFPQFPITNLDMGTTPAYKDVSAEVARALRDHFELVPVYGAIITLLIHGGTYVFTDGPHTGKTIVHLTVTYEV